MNSPNTLLSVIPSEIINLISGYRDTIHSIINAPISVEETEWVLTTHKHLVVMYYDEI